MQSVVVYFYNILSFFQIGSIKTVEIRYRHTLGIEPDNFCLTRRDRLCKITDCPDFSGLRCRFCRIIIIVENFPVTKVDRFITLIIYFKEIVSLYPIFLRCGCHLCNDKRRRLLCGYSLAGQCGCLCLRNVFIATAVTCCDEIFRRRTEKLTGRDRCRKRFSITNRYHGNRCILGRKAFLTGSCSLFISKIYCHSACGSLIRNLCCDNHVAVAGSGNISDLHRCLFYRYSGGRYLSLGHSARCCCCNVHLLTFSSRCGISKLICQFACVCAVGDRVAKLIGICLHQYRIAVFSNAVAALIGLMDSCMFHTNHIDIIIQTIKILELRVGSGTQVIVVPYNQRFPGTNLYRGQLCIVRYT